MIEHTLTLEGWPYFSSDYVYFAVCSCGYRSGKNTSAGLAWLAGVAHVKAKTELASPGTPG